MDSSNPGILIHVCRQCLADRAPLPHQWVQSGVHVRVRVLPCSGKIDPEYMFGAMEAGAQGLMVVTCPKGECKLSQGNYRAEIRAHTVQRLLSETGLEPDRVVLAHCSPEDDLRAMIDSAVEEFCGLGDSPLRTRTVTAD